MFSAQLAESSTTTLCLEEVRQVAVPVGRQDNCIVWLSSSERGAEGEICCLQLTYCFINLLVKYRWTESVGLGRVPNLPHKMSEV